MINKSGSKRRSKEDNYVTYAPGLVNYKGKSIDYNFDKAHWLLYGEKPGKNGSLSDLSKDLGLNVETHDIGRYLELKGYIFKTPFNDSDMLSDLKDILKNGNITATEKQVLAKARIGQGQFRDKLINYWKACAVTNCTSNSILKASHIKPWRHCLNNKERLDAYNGLLLTPNLDTLFDRGFISFSDNGLILISESLKENDAKLLGIQDGLKLSKVESHHLKYLHYHRNNIFA